MHWEFYFHGNSEVPTIQAITSTWANVVGVSRQWPVPHKKTIISDVEVIFPCDRSVETFAHPALHWEFYFHCNSEAASDQTITSTWANVVELVRLWPVTHKEAKISHVEVISDVAESWNLSFFQCIENFTFMAILKHLQTRRSVQHEQLWLD